MANTPFVVFAETGNSVQTQPNSAQAAGDAGQAQLDAAQAAGDAGQAQLDSAQAAGDVNTVVEIKDPNGGNNPPPPQPSFNMMIPFIILIGVMIAISIRTSSKEKKKREQMMNSIRKGTKIMTSGGIIGEIAEVQQDQFLLKIANNVQIVIARAAIAQVIQTADAADDTKAEVTKK